MTTKICKRSGLEFQTDNNRLTVHPEISRYTSHKDTEIRYPAIAVIERGKAEGWETIEQFESEIQKALNPVPQPIDQIKGDFEGDWVALIKGFSEKYGYDRDFLDSVGKRGRFKLFQYPEAGIVETCYTSAKGNQTRYFRLIEAGKEVGILTAGEVDEFLGGRPQVSDQLAATDSWKVESTKSLGAVGETIQIDGVWVVIVAIDCETTYHDEDGISHRGRYPRNVEVIYETYKYKTTVKRIQGTN
jgi:hypothetical protein